MDGLTSEDEILPRAQQQTRHSTNSMDEKDDDSLHETPILGTSLPSLSPSRSPSRTSTKSPSKSHETTSTTSFIETTPLIHEIQNPNPTSPKRIVFDTPKTTNMDPFDSGIDSGAPKPKYTGNSMNNYQQNVNTQNSNFNNSNLSPRADSKGRRRNLNSTSSQGAFAQTPCTKPLSKTQINMIITFLCLFNLVNYMDRYTIIAVADTYLKPIFGLQEKSIGLISSIFIISYMLMSPIAGYLGDRTNRKWLIVGGAIIWMTCVAVGSFIPDETEEDRAKAWNYLLITRIFFGVGEACYVCVAPAIIHDLFIEDTKRTNYLILFNMMVPVGSGLGYVVGGWAAQYFEDWKMALRVTLPIGIVTLILFIVLTKPVPHAYSEIMHAAKQQKENPTRDSISKKTQGFVMREKTFKQTIRDFSKNKTFVFTTIGFTAICFVLGSGTTWLPILFTRAKQIHGIDVASGDLKGVNFLPCSNYQISENATIDCKSKNYQTEHESVKNYFYDVKNKLSSGGNMEICEDPTSYTNNCQTQNNISYCQCKVEEVQLSSDVFMLFGFLATLSGIAGALAGGKMSDKWKRSGNPRAESDICAIGLLFGSILLYISIVIVGNNDLRLLNWGIYWLGLTCINFNWALVSKIVLSIVEPNEKSMANAFLNTIGHLFGDASSSVIIGALADYVGTIFRKNIIVQLPEGETVSKEWFDFLQIQQAMLLLPVVCAFGCMAFFFGSMYIEGDTKSLDKLKLETVEVIETSDSGNESSPAETPIEHTNKVADAPR